MSHDDLTLIEIVLDGLWAPRDGDPQAAPTALDDDFTDGLTVNDVIRARRALNRLRGCPGHESEGT